MTAFRNADVRPCLLLALVISPGRMLRVGKAKKR
jgi:hypothetical protein